MIKLNDRFSFKRDPYQWILYEVVDSKDRDGNDKSKTRTTYHSTLKQVATAVLERSTDHSKTLEEMISSFDAAVSEITEQLKNHS